MKSMLKVSLLEGISGNAQMASCLGCGFVALRAVYWQRPYGCSCILMRWVLSHSTNSYPQKLVMILSEPRKVVCPSMLKRFCLVI